MKQTVMTIMLMILLSACTEMPQNENIRPTPSPSPSSSIEQRPFRITEPKSESEVTTNVITVKGEGARPGDSIEVHVQTNQWYAQKGKYEIDPDGTWSYGPCHLRGEGEYRLNHTIKATLIREGKAITSSTVEKVRAPEPGL
jgi:hypothetical protein